MDKADKATTAEATAGTSDSKWMTPKTTKEAVEGYLKENGADSVVVDGKVKKIIEVPALINYAPLPYPTFNGKQLGYYSGASFTPFCIDGNIYALVASGTIIGVQQIDASTGALKKLVAKDLGSVTISISSWKIMNSRNNTIEFMCSSSPYIYINFTTNTIISITNSSIGSLAFTTDSYYCYFDVNSNPWRITYSTNSNIFSSATSGLSYINLPNIKFGGDTILGIENDTVYMLCYGSTDTNVYNIISINLKTNNIAYATTFSTNANTPPGYQQQWQIRPLYIDTDFNLYAAFYAQVYKSSSDRTYNYYGSRSIRKINLRSTNNDTLIPPAWVLTSTFGASDSNSYNTLTNGQCTFAVMDDFLYTLYGQYTMRINLKTLSIEDIDMLVQNRGFGSINNIPYRLVPRYPSGTTIFYRTNARYDMTKKVARPVFSDNIYHGSDYATCDEFARYGIPITYVGLNEITEVTRLALDYAFLYSKEAPGYLADANKSLAVMKQNIGSSGNIIDVSSTDKQNVLRDIINGI